MRSGCLHACSRYRMFRTRTLSSCFTPCSVGSVMVIFRVHEGKAGRSSISGLPVMQRQCFYIKVFPLSSLPETLLMDGVRAVQSQEVNNATPNVATMNVPKNEVLDLPQASQVSDSNFKEPNISDYQFYNVQERLSHN